MSEDLGDFLKEAARRRKERRERQEAEAASRPRAGLGGAEPPERRAAGEGSREVRESLADQARVGRADSLADQARGSRVESLAESEAARYAAREHRAERVGFAERPAPPPVSPPLSATPSPMPGAFSRPQGAAPGEEESDAEGLLRLLRSPDGIRQAFLLSEILRPKHLDG